MAELRWKNLGQPDETIRLPGVEIKVVDLGDLTIARAVHEPGWRWSTHVRPQVGGDWCQVRHVGFVAAGRLGIQLEDGTAYEFGPDDAYDIPPGHDGYVIGHEPTVMIEWTGVRAFAGFMGGAQNRVLVTLLFTDLVDSSVRASQLGDAAWRDLLSRHFETARTRIAQFRGREVATTGDGVLATFGGPAQALSCAAEIRRAARSDGLELRAGVHVGEVEAVADDVRGVAVHEAERIMRVAGPGEILVSDTTRVLAAASGLSFNDRGLHTLKGLPGERQLFAYDEGRPPP